LLFPEIINHPPPLQGLGQRLPAVRLRLGRAGFRLGQPDERLRVGSRLLTSSDWSARQQVELENMRVDNRAMRLIDRLTSFDVILANNMGRSLELLCTRPFGAYIHPGAMH